MKIEFGRKLAPVFLLFFSQLSLAFASTYEHFSEEQMKEILDGPTKNTKWEERIKNYKRFLLNPNDIRYSGYMGVLQYTDDDLKEMSYKANPVLDLTGSYELLFGKLTFYGAKSIKEVFNDIYQSLTNLTLYPTFSERYFNMVNIGDKAENTEDGVKNYKKDTDVAFAFRKFIKMSCDTVREDDKWYFPARVFTAFSPYKEKWNALIKTGDRLTLSFVSTFINMCFLYTSDGFVDAFGNKMIEIVKAINADPRVVEQGHRLFYYQLDVTAIFKEAGCNDMPKKDITVYYPMFVPEGSRVVYGAPELLSYLTKGQMQVPIARLFEGAELKVDEETCMITDAACLLAPAKTLVNGIPMNIPLPKGQKTVYKTGDLISSCDYEAGARLSTDVTFQELGKLVIWLNGGKFGNSVGGAIYTDHAADTHPMIPGKMPSLPDGIKRMKGYVALFDFVAYLFNQENRPQEKNGQVVNVFDGSVLSYSDYTVYHLPLEEITGIMCNSVLVEGGDPPANVGVISNSCLVPKTIDSDIKSGIVPGRYWTFDKTMVGKPPAGQIIDEKPKEEENDKKDESVGTDDLDQDNGGA